MDEKCIQEAFTNTGRHNEAGMQLAIDTSFQQSQLNISQFTFNQTTNFGIPSSLPSPEQDRVEFSDEALQPRDSEHAIGHLRHAHHERSGTQLTDLLKDILTLLTGAQVNDLQHSPAASDGSTMPPPTQQTSLAAEQAILSVETGSLSIEGSINTADGATVSFSLDLEILHTSASASTLNLNTGPNGYEFSFAGSSAELTSTSFSFSLTAEVPDGTSASGNGRGTFSLKDELKAIKHTLKPLIKDFLYDAGLPSAKRSISQLLHTIV